MGEFLCSVPGTDGSVAAWHAVVHVGLTAFVVVAGTWFTAAAIVAYRRSDPRPAATAVEPDASGGPRRPRLAPTPPRR